MFRSMNQHRTLLLALSLALAGLASCATNAMSHRTSNTNPDERLAELLKEYDRARSGHTEGGDSDHVLIDGERVRNQIERLALEFPRHAPTLLANAVLARENRQPEKAEGYCDAALAVQPVNPEVAVLKAQLAIEANNLAGARRLLAAQVEYTPNHAALRETYAALLLSAGELGEAQKQLAAAERLGAPAWRVAFNQGLLAEARKDRAAARKAYESCLAARPDYAPAQARLAGMNAEGGVQ